jgi:hypothetical protein
MWLVRNLVGGDLTLLPPATPIHRVSTTTGPMFLASSLNELVPGKEVGLMASALIAAGVPVDAMVLQGSRHGEGYMVDALAPSLAFLERYVG